MADIKLYTNLGDYSDDKDIKLVDVINDEIYYGEVEQLGKTIIYYIHTILWALAFGLLGEGS